MKTIFVVVDGEYSDFHIEGIFSTKENADLYCKKIKGTVVEYELDVGIDKLKRGYLPYMVDMKRNGDIDRCDTDAYNFGDAQSNRFELLGKYGKTNNAIIFMFAKDEKHAIKIANERRIAKIASGEWK